MLWFLAVVRRQSTCDGTAMTRMHRILNINTPLGEDNAMLMAMSCQEALGRMPEYKLTLATRRGDLTATDLLGKNITVGMEMPGWQDLRYFNGYVTGFTDAGSAPASCFENGNGRAWKYELVMHPWLWFLTRSSDCRIFQNLTVPQIVKKVCDDYPFSQLDMSLLRVRYPTKEYVCQYRETDYNFILRLMEHEGIYFSFVHENGQHTMKLFDSWATHGPYEEYATIPYSDTGSAHANEVEYITQWHVARAVQPGQVTLGDYDFMKPRVTLLRTAFDKRGHDLDFFEVFDHPGDFDMPGAGEERARMRMQELQVAHEVISASGPVRGIEPGRTFKLKGHPRAADNREYLVSGATYDMTNNLPASVGCGGGGGSGNSGGDIHCSFKVIFSQTQFRPPRATAKPVVQGMQTGVVVGPEGEEIHVDQYGRIKVQFRWDRYNNAGENSSCWVRVSQPWAGKEWGAMFLPRVGHEVLVSFLEGDPDQPMVVGRLHHHESRPPWPLPAEKTRSGFKTRTYKGDYSTFNEFSFDDKKGAEEVYVQAERDKIERVKHDRFDDVGNESHITIHKDAFQEIKGDSHLKVVGDDNNEAGGSLSFKVSQDTQIRTGQKFAVDAGIEIHINAGMKVVIEAGASLSLKAGGNFITINSSGVFIKGAMVTVNSGDGDAGSGAAPIAPKPPRAPRTSKGGADVKPVKPTPPAAYSPQALRLKLAWTARVPFCAQCEAAKLAQRDPIL